MLMIDSSRCFERRDTKNVLSAEGIENTVNVFKSGKEADGFAKWVTAEEIAEQKNHLVVRTYVGGEGHYKGAARRSRPALTFDQARADYEKVRTARQREEAAIDSLIESVSVASGVAWAGARRLQLAEIAEPESLKVKVDPNEEYAVVGILNAGQGLFWRETISGAETTYATLRALRAGQLVYRKLTAWEGPVTVVPVEFDGGFVSSEFPTFRLNEAIVLPEFMALICQRPAFWNEMRIRSRGTAERRGRLNPEDMLKVEIQLPDIDAQGKFVALARLGRRLEREREALDAVNGAALERLLAGEES
jgi:type I restriction-modification system DNA methylase subunit